VAFDDDFRTAPRYALNCASWTRGGSQRHAAVAASRRSAIRADGDERRRRIRAYARDQRVSERDAESQLFGDGED